ncbi:unnamed protein product [Cuscuta epithymum]|uniref:Uncharacterized protein n=1 Tax=Cuscuta epithymum TaxID=186058 RepID=A0AAV0DCQ2_9ASTE|nr:unnamed protein product [Cuscuta epithymum]
MTSTTRTYSFIGFCNLPPDSRHALARLSYYRQDSTHFHAVTSHQKGYSIRMIAAADKIAVVAADMIGAAKDKIAAAAADMIAAAADMIDAAADMIAAAADKSAATAADNKNAEEHRNSTPGYPLSGRIGSKTRIQTYLSPIFCELHRTRPGKYPHPPAAAARIRASSVSTCGYA